MLINAATALVLDPGGAAPYSSGVPYDGAPNEEYWGIVDVFRTEKLAYGIVNAAYTGTVCLVSAHAGPDQFLPVGSTWTTLDAQPIPRPRSAVSPRIKCESR